MIQSSVRSLWPGESSSLFCINAFHANCPPRQRYHEREHRWYLRRSDLPCRRQSPLPSRFQRRSCGALGWPCSGNRSVYRHPSPAPSAQRGYRRGSRYSGAFQLACPTAPYDIYISNYVASIVWLFVAVWTSLRVTSVVGQTEVAVLDGICKYAQGGSLAELVDRPSRLGNLLAVSIISK